MSRWKELPAELHPHVQQLIVRLRKLKDRSELSTSQLAAKTGYSARSWQRYLNGRSLPPREAVEAVARIGGDDPTRLLALHEIAAERWAEGRAVTAGAPSASRRHRRARPRSSSRTAVTRRPWSWRERWPWCSPSPRRSCWPPSSPKRAAGSRRTAPMPSRRARPLCRSPWCRSSTPAGWSRATAAGTRA
ncbi:helix-turn-helix domain-containing protein [Streptomyces dysideae]|uniref:helix-turn-helix domain-containing protein n=1 Tax=Streptomyces dysideae TaxID=909626 RepID=UPI002D21C376|nr:helix-turn-helix transcriptional regulator [Streptomyces dysideae]